MNQTKEYKLCPVLGAGPVEINTDCKEERCAWWTRFPDGSYGCAVRALMVLPDIVKAVRSV